MLVAPATAFDALFNFRDLGGFETITGEVTRYGHVFRSDGVHRCTPDDVRRLEQLGIRRVVDLRTVHERADDGCFDPQHPHIDYRHVPILDDVSGAGKPSSLHDEPLVATYLDIVTARGERIVEALRWIVNSPGPVVFHCAAGKDRTGVVAALALATIGVPDERIIADYARSAEAMERLIAWYRERRNGEQQLVVTRTEEDDARLQRALSADPAWMQFVLDAVRLEYGTVRRYLVAVGATPSLIDGLHTKLLG